MTRTGLRSFGIVLVVFVLGLAAGLGGCASLGPVAPVEVSDVKDVSGTWKGAVYQSSQFSPDYITLTIREDGSYDIVSARQPIGTSRGQGKVAISDGRLMFEGPRGRGVGRVQKNPDGSLTMMVDGTLSDNSTLSAQLTRIN
jgi:hypothetical protein